MNVLTLYSDAANDFCNLLESCEFVLNKFGKQTVFEKKLLNNYLYVFIYSNYMDKDGYPYSIVYFEDDKTHYDDSPLSIEEFIELLDVDSKKKFIYNMDIFK